MAASTQEGRGCRTPERTTRKEGTARTMNKSIMVLAVIVATLVVSFAGRPVLAASIPSATAVVTVKDFKFTSTFEIRESAVGVEVDRNGDILIGLLFTGGVQKVTPEGKASPLAELPVVNPVPPPPVCPLRPDPPSRASQDRVYDRVCPAQQR
jgi:hypothetical protein